jgi:hypothetical protein
MGSYTTVRGSCDSTEARGMFGLVTFEYKLKIGLARHIGPRDAGATEGHGIESPYPAVGRPVGATQIADFWNLVEICGENARGSIGTR